MNKVKLSYNPFIPELEIFTNDIELEGYSRLSKYKNVPFFVWNELIFNELYREINDEYYVEFQSCDFECEIIKKISEKFPQCKELTIVKPDIQMDLQERFIKLEEINKYQNIYKDIKINVYSENIELANALKEILIEYGIFEEIGYKVTSKAFPMINLEYLVKENIELIGNEEGIDIFISEYKINQCMINLLKSSSKPIFAFELGSHTNFKLKDNNIYIYTVEPEEIQEKFMNIIQGANLSDAIKELSAQINSELLSKNDKYKLQEVMLTSKKYIINSFNKVNIGRRINIEVVELPGRISNEEYLLTSDDINLIDIDGMSIIGKNEGKAYVIVYIYDGYKNREIGIVEINVVKYKLIEQIRVCPENIFLSTDMSRKLEITLIPDNADNIDEIKWESSDNEIATVDENGVVYSNNIGKCDIRVITEETRAMVKVEVQPKLKDIIVGRSLLLTVGDKVEFKYTLIPENCFERELITIYNSNNDVVELKGNYIVAKKSGVTTITVSTTNKDIKRICRVEVKRRSFFL